MSGMQVKIISVSSNSQLEANINQWLEVQGDKIEIVDISFTHVNTSSSIHRFTAYIQYVPL
jgi:hypothetical protein